MDPHELTFLTAGVATWSEISEAAALWTGVHLQTPERGRGRKDLEGERERDRDLEGDRQIEPVLHHHLDPIDHEQEDDDDDDDDMGLEGVKKTPAATPSTPREKKAGRAKAEKELDRRLEELPEVGLSIHHSLAAGRPERILMKSHRRWYRAKRRNRGLIHGCIDEAIPR